MKMSKNCKKCGNVIPNCAKIDGVKKFLGSRKLCLNCSPFNAREISHRICVKCGESFPMVIIVNGKRKGLHNRKFCLKCSPYGQHNTSNLLKNDDKERWCPNCEKMVSKEDFYIRRGTDCSPYCKKCLTIVCVNRQKMKKIKAIEYMGGKCCECGYSKCVSALEFHHKDSSQKDADIKITLASFEKVKAELDKCIMVCANCHREIHEKIRMDDSF